MALVETAATQSAVAVGGGVESEAERFYLKGMQTLREDPQAAYRMLKVASDLDPNDGRTVEAIRDAERLIKTNLEKDGVKPNAIPELAIPVGDLTSRTFSPQEGFVLSRINAQWDVKSIMKISPMKELDVLMIFQRLLKARVIKWKKK
jgi:hypothetical protein